jgi:hypothetical protein
MMDLIPPVLKRHWPLALAALFFAAYGWALVVTTGSGHDGLIGPHFNALGADWVIFMTAGRAVFTGDLAHIYNQLWITQTTNSQFAHWLSGPLPAPLFPYPPVYLLLVAPFAMLSVGWSLLLSQLAQVVALALALRRLAPDKLYLFFLLGALLCPALSNNVLAGSNAVLVAALIVAGLSLLDTRPILAGALLGLVIFKPQYFPLLPLALIAARRIDAFAAMTASAILFTLLSALLLGPQLWLDWINVYLHPQQVAGVNATEWGHIWDESVSTIVTLLGAPHWLALAAQGAGALVAATFVWRAFREAHSMRIAILCCAVLLASPHVSNYDLVLLAVAALLYVRSLPQSSRPLTLVLPLAAYAAPIYNPPRAMPLGLITPVVILGLMVVLWTGFPSKRLEKPLASRG